MIRSSIILFFAFVTTAGAQTALRCPEGHPATGDLGIEYLLCVGGSCSVNLRTDRGYAHDFSTEPRVRGSFMSLNASIQQLGAGVAALVAGSLVGKAADGTLSGVGNVGWLAAAFTVVSVALAYGIRGGVDRGAGAPPE